MLTTKVYKVSINRVMPSAKYLTFYIKPVSMLSTAKPIQNHLFVFPIKQLSLVFGTIEDRLHQSDCPQHCIYEYFLVNKD